MDISFEYIPKDKRKKILLICDDMRVHSGIATVAKEMVVHTCQHFNWAQIGGAVKHPDKGKRFDLSEATTTDAEGMTESVDESKQSPADGDKPKEEKKEDKKKPKKGKGANFGPGAAVQGAAIQF